MPGSESTAKACRVAVVHPGTQYAPRLAEQLEAHRLLGSFWTGIGASDAGWLAPLLRPTSRNPLARLLSRRVVRGVPPGRLQLQPWPEILATWRQRQGRDLQAVWHRRNESFQRGLPTRLFRDHPIVIGFDTSSWLVAERCAAAGSTFVLDQSIGHASARERTYAAVRLTFPEWGHELEVRRAEVARAEAREHALAARIVASSAFARDTLVAQGVSADRVVVNPYGVDSVRFHPRRSTAAGRPLRFVFVGQVTARKGVPLLLAAWTRLGPPGAELWLVGHVAARTQPLLAGVPGVRVCGPVPHGELPGLLGACDVFVFPSYFEGFAQVVPEALACGLPAIASEASGARDIVRDGVDGFLVPTGDGDALEAAMARFAQDRGLAARMSAAARARAEEFTWNAYGDRWARLLAGLDAERTAAREALV